MLPSFARIDYTGVPETVPRCGDGTAQLELTEGDDNCAMASETGSAQTSEPLDVLRLVASLRERLSRVSGEDVAHSELLAKQIEEWDNLLTRPASSSSEPGPGDFIPMEDVLPRAIEEAHHEQPATFVDLHECLEKVFTLVEVFAKPWSIRFLPEVFEYARVCTNFKRCMEEVCRRRRGEQRHLVIERYPTFIEVEARLGRPVSLLPPIWRSFKVEVWWYFDSHRTHGTRWQLHSERWVTSLSEVERVWYESFRTVGFYTHVQLVVSMWTFDLLDEDWAEEDHV